MSNCSGEDSKTTILNTTRRQLLAFGLAGAAAAWMGPELGWVTRAEAAGPPPKPAGQAIVGLSQEPTVFNPLMLHIEVDEAVYFNLFSGLWRVDPKGNFTPDLASEIPSLENGGISADGLTWRIKVNQRRRHLFARRHARRSVVIGRERICPWLGTLAWSDQAATAP